MGDKGWLTENWRYKKRRAGEETHPGMPPVFLNQKIKINKMGPRSFPTPNLNSNSQTIGKRNAKSPQKKALSIKTILRNNTSITRPPGVKKWREMVTKKSSPFSTRPPPIHTTVLGLHLWLVNFLLDVMAEPLLTFIQKNITRTRVARPSCYYCYLFLVLTSSPSEKAFILISVPIWSTDRNVICMALRKKQK